MAKQFTKDEMAILMKNPYTLSVTEKSIKHTLEFKELYWAKYTQGFRPSQIFRECGYDIAILSERRINGFTQHIKKEYAKYGYFREPRPHGAAKPPRSTDYEKMRQKTAMKEMQTELTYLRQEVDFLKKLIRLERKEK